MSYYATADGSIRFKNRISEEQFEDLLDVLLEVFEEYDTKDNYQQVFFGGHIKYDDDIVLELLSNVTDDYEIEEGEVDYIGEDSALWRHIFVDGDGEWKEQNGKVVYT